MRLVALLAVVVLIVNIGNPFGLHQNDEDLYVEVARQMLADGNWLVPRWYGETFFSKPPLLYWMMMVSMSVFGDSLLAARLPVALCAIMLAVATAALATRLASPRAGMLAGVMTATTIGFFQYGRAAMMDVPLALLLVLAAWGAYAASRGSVAGCYAAFAAAGLCSLLKGPVGPVVAAGGVMLWTLARRYTADGGTPLPRRHLMAALALGLAIAAAWPAALYMRGLGSVWYLQFILNENAAKFSGGNDSLLEMLSGAAALLMPWTPIFVAALWVLARRRDHNMLLPVCFMAANVGAYALPAIKWAHYLLPSLPMAAIVTGWALDQPSKLMRMSAVIAAVPLLLAAPLVLLATRLQPDQNYLLIATTASLLAAAGFLALGRAEGAAMAIALALAGAAAVAPHLTVDRIPADFAQVVGQREVVAWHHPPTRYSTVLKRDVKVSSADEKAFREHLQRGALVIIADSQLNRLMLALDPQQTEMLLCWRKWKPGLTSDDVRAALREGRTMGLQENICVLGKRN